MRKIVPSLWFADNNCEDAIHYYMSVFPNSSIDFIEYYPDKSLDTHFEGMQGKIITASFTLNNTKFTALDGGPAFRFNESISFTIECENQLEIDYYWNKLSHVPDAEQCGWVKDQFGISWQIIPYNMRDLINSDAKIQAMMKMKKIEINILEDA